MARERNYKKQLKKYLIKNDSLEELTIFIDNMDDSDAAIALGDLDDLSESGRIFSIKGFYLNDEGHTSVEAYYDGVKFSETRYRKFVKKKFKIENGWVNPEFHIQLGCGSPWPYEYDIRIIGIYNVNQFLTSWLNQDFSLIKNWYKPIVRKLKISPFYLYKDSGDKWINKLKNNFKEHYEIEKLYDEQLMRIKAQGKKIYGTFEDYKNKIQSDLLELRKEAILEITHSKNHYFIIY